MSNDLTGKEFANPFNYTGSKHRYLNEILKVLPTGKHLKVLDPFVGGGDLISKLPAGWGVCASDKCHQLISMHDAIQSGQINNGNILSLKSKLGLNRFDTEKYLELRDRYNSLNTKGIPSPNLLYLLICHSNSNIMRFNKSGGFNVPFGKRTFNESLQEKLSNYSQYLRHASVNFYTKDFMGWDFLEFDLLLIDPPYTGSIASYNERGGWTIEQEMSLYLKVDDAASNGVKFVLFGQVWANGAYNKMLDMWSRKYKIVELKNTSHQCSHNRKNKKTVEIMVFNK